MECDLIVGNLSDDDVLLNIVERKILYSFTYKLPDKKVSSVMKAFGDFKNLFGENFDKVFSTITTDNKIFWRSFKFFLFKRLPTFSKCFCRHFFVFIQIFFQQIYIKFISYKNSRNAVTSRFVNHSSVLNCKRNFISVRNNFYLLHIYHTRLSDMQSLELFCR